MGKNQKLKLVEVGRGVAALLVVLHHATINAPHFYNYSPFSNFFAFGKVGVEFFFVLSGFIIYYIHGKDDRSSLKTYVLKRVIRVYPIYILITLGLLILYSTLPTLSEGSKSIDWYRIIGSLLLIPMDGKPILTVGWTLMHEMFFYTIFIFVLVNKSFSKYLFVFWGIGILIFNSLNNQTYYLFHFIFSLYNIEFLFGILLGIIIVNNNFTLTIKQEFLILLFGVIAFILNAVNMVYKYIDFTHLITHIVNGVSAAIILYGLISISKVITKVPKYLLLLGAASYSIYLTHNPVQALLHRVVRVAEIHHILYGELIFLLVVFLSLLPGIFVYLIVEKPLLSYMRKKIIKM